MIEALDRVGRGSRCVVRCDDCGTAQYETCDYERRAAGDWAPNEGQVIHRLTKQGWAHVKGRLRCMACEVKRKATSKEHKDMSDKVTALRQPTLEQKRQIIEMLGAVYDTAAQRYKDCESDVTVADAIGGGCMFGWVAKLREEFYGPDGRNEELDRLRADMAAWQGQGATALANAEKAVADLKAQMAAVHDMQVRMDRLVKAAGPRAGAA